MKEGSLFNLSRLRALLLSIEQGIGWNDPELNHGRVGGAAARLGMKRTTLQSKMRKLGISRRS